MSTIIGAETARWAGLQIDLHSKFRSGSLTADQLEWWLNQSRDTRDALMNGQKPVVVVEASAPMGKFALLVDLGIITVPDDYDHKTALKTFGKKNRKKFYYYEEAITDQNFPNPTRILKPGDKLRVRVFQQIVGGTRPLRENEWPSSPRRRRFMLERRAQALSLTRSVASCQRAGGMLPSMNPIDSGKIPSATAGCRTCAGARAVTSTGTSVTSGASGTATTPSSASATHSFSLSLC